MKKEKKESVIGVVFSSNRKEALLVKRRDVPVWVLPGGGIEIGETPEQAIVREFLEETGYQVKIIRKVGEYSPQNHLTRFTHLYECKIEKGNAQVNEESSSIRFFSVDSLPKLLPPPYEQWIEDSLFFSSKIIQRKLSEISYFLLLKTFLLHPILIARFLLSRIGLHWND